MTKFVSLLSPMMDRHMSIGIGKANGKPRVDRIVLIDNYKGLIN